MSAIVGIYYPDGQSVKQKDLASMLDSLAHRGPDGAHLWCDGSIGLGHRMLWTTPESLREKLPLTDNLGQWILTADARIDNREELILKLGLQDRCAETITDSQLLLFAYQNWGKDCPKQLLGDFAFTIWDGDKQQLFCARDHMGVKPFYYHYRANRAFLFASEMKALLRLTQVPKHLNEVRLGDFFIVMLEDKVSTTYDQIWRLPPAHSLVVNRDGLKTWCYWKLDPDRELRLGSDAEYAQQFQEIFNEAVRCRLRSAFPLGSHLSGGLDSSSVTCLARDLLADGGDVPLHTFSCVFDTVSQCDERSYIKEVLDQKPGLIPHFIKADRSGPLSDIEEIFQYEDEAFVGPVYYLPWITSRAIQEAGVRVCLDGFDGDTTVSHGLYRMTELARQGQWQLFSTETKAFAQRYGCSAYGLFDNHAVPVLQELSQQFKWLGLIQAIQQLYHSFGISRRPLLWRSGIQPWIDRWRHFTQPSNSYDLNEYHLALLNPDFTRRINLEQRLRQFLQSSSLPLTVKMQHWQSLNSGVITYVLEQLDRCTAAFSLEARHPFMDKRLIEFCLSLPSEQKLSQGWSRVVFRRAMTNILPTIIQWRGDKGDLSANWTHGLQNLDRQKLDWVFMVDNHNHHDISGKFSNSARDCLKQYLNLEIPGKCYRKLLIDKKSTVEERMAIWQAVNLFFFFLSYEQKI